jgi:hypothetical protein
VQTRTTNQETIMTVPAVANHDASLRKGGPGSNRVLSQSEATDLYFKKIHSNAEALSLQLSRLEEALASHKEMVRALERLQQDS